VRIDPAGLPSVAVALLPALVAVWLDAHVIALILGVLPIAIALFFRDPDRSSPQDPNLVLAPADGRVMYAGIARPEEAPKWADGAAAETAAWKPLPTGAWQQVTIFLSPLDVHINRTPVAGKVTRVEYQPGTFLPAYKPESHGNERSEIWIDHSGIPIVARQVVGLLARRVVCRLAPGQWLQPGERIGLMKFGSRMDVFVPVTAEIKVKAGESVRAGITVIAILESPAS
jgi:phosphatidylserine decarboxylase